MTTVFAVDENIENQTGETAETAEIPNTQMPNSVGVDPEAPWGRRADGTPRGKPGPKTDGSAPKSSTKKTRKVTAPKPAMEREDPSAAFVRRKTALMETRAIPISLAIGAAKISDRLGQKEHAAGFKMDAATIELHAENLVNAVTMVADTNPKLARGIDKLTENTPMMLLGTAALGFVAQIAVNHGFLGAGFLGTHSRSEMQSVGDQMFQRFEETMAAQQQTQEQE